MGLLENAFIFRLSQKYLRLKNKLHYRAQLWMLARCLEIYLIFSNSLSNACARCPMNPAKRITYPDMSWSCLQKTLFIISENQCCAFSHIKPWRKFWADRISVILNHDRVFNPAKNVADKRGFLKCCHLACNLTRTIVGRRKYLGIKHSLSMQEHWYTKQESERKLRSNYTYNSI